MKKILVLGAGMVAAPLLDYLLKVPEYHLTVASLDITPGIKRMFEGRHNGKIISLDVSDDESLENLVKEHDISISLLPYTFHPKVAGMCIKHKKHMATASYVSDAMRSMDSDAKAAGITILNELGVDPGIDHMSAMRVIHDVLARGGKVTEFRSYCGGLPAPEADDNPFGYKFSWSPRGVLMAGKNDATYLEDGETIKINGKDLFDNFWTLEIEGAGLFEGYPNRNSLGYIDLYGLHEAKTMFRGTLRNLGWCSILKKVVDLGLVEDKIDENLKGLTYAKFMAKIANCPGENVKNSIAKKCGLDDDSPEINAMEWLGLFSDEAIPEGVIPSPIDVMTDLMLRKMSYNEGERDMLVLHHMFTANFKDHDEEITSTMVDFGIPGGDSSMARTVSLPLAIAVRLLLEGKITLKGVQVPVVPEIYRPVLDELETLGIKCVEKTKMISHK